MNTTAEFGVFVKLDAVEPGERDGVSDARRGQRDAC